MAMTNEVNVRIKADSKGAEDSIKRFQGTVRKAGVALSAIGGIGLLSIKKFTSAALEQELAMAGVLNSARMAGDGMEGLRDRIERTTAALQNKSNYGDEQQMRVLAKMIPMLGSTEKALMALPVIMDAAATTGRDLSSQSETLTKALAGTVHQAESLGLKFDQTAPFSERLAQTFDLVGGAAEAQINPMIQLGNATGDAGEKIGDAMLPALLPLVQQLAKLAVKIQQIDPAITKVAGSFFVAATAIGLIVGPLMLAWAALGKVLIVMKAMTLTPIGLVITAIGVSVLVLVDALGGWERSFDLIKQGINKLIPILNQYIKLINLYTKALSFMPGITIPAIKSIKELRTGIIEILPPVGDLGEGMEDLYGPVLVVQKSFDDLRKTINNMTATELPPLMEAQLRLGDIIDKVGGKTFDWNDKIDELVNTGLFSAAEATNEVAAMLEGRHSQAMRKAADDVLGLKENLDDVKESFNDVMQGMLDVVDSQRLLDEAIAKRFGRKGPLSESENQLMGALTGTTGGNIRTSGQAGFEALALINQGNVRAGAEALQAAGLGADFSGRAGITINVNATTSGSVDDMVAQIMAAMDQVAQRDQQTRNS